MRSPPPVACVLALGLLVAACGGDGSDQDPPPSEGPSDGPSSAGLDTEVELAVADLAASAGGDESDIEVVTAERVTWPDGSIGCPQPEEMYTQALVEGYRIVLRAGGDEVAYHGQDGGEPMRCDEPADPVD